MALRYNYVLKSSYFKMTSNASFMSNMSQLTLKELAQISENDWNKSCSKREVVNYKRLGKPWWRPAVSEDKERQLLT